MTHEQITARAVEIWQRRGCPAGADLDIWLEAERDLRRPGGRVADPNIARAEETDRELENDVAQPPPRSPTAL